MQHRARPCVPVACTHVKATNGVFVVRASAETSPLHVAPQSDSIPGLPHLHAHIHPRPSAPRAASAPVVVEGEGGGMQEWLVPRARPSECATTRSRWGNARGRNVDSHRPVDSRYAQHDKPQRPTRSQQQSRVPKRERVPSWGSNCHRPSVSGDGDNSLLPTPLATHPLL